MPNLSHRIRSLTALAIAVPLVAQSAFAAGSVRFDIAEQPLGNALRALASQADTNVMFNEPLVSGRSAGPLKMEGTLGEALARILADTGITYRFLNEHTVVLEKQGARNSGESPRGEERIRVSQASSAADASRSSIPADGSKENAIAQGSAGTADDTTLQEITVTAQKRKERVQDVPISISVLNGQDLDRSTVQGITEALTRVPGVAAIAHSQSGGTLVTMRGVAASGPVFGGSSPIAYYLDSVPFGLVQTAIAPDANAYDLERVEVLRGPQGTLYGANAQNGVVRVLVKDADPERFELKTRGSLSSTQEGGGNLRGDVALNVPLIEGKLAARAVVGHEKLSGWVDQPIKRNANDAELGNARLKVNAQPTEQLAVGAFVWLSRQDYGAPSYSNDQSQTLSLIDESNSIDYDVYGIKASYDFSGVSVSSVTGYIDYENGGAYDLINEGLTDSFGLFTGFDAHVFSQEINVNSTHAGPWRWTAGGIYRDGRDRTFQEIPGLIAPAGWTNTSKSYAIFGELSRRFHGDKMEWTLGGRYFNDEVMSKEDPVVPPLNPPFYYRAEESFHATTPRTVLTWNPTKDVTVYGSYSQGFRSGTPQPFYVTGGVPGFPAVKPDKLRNSEVGVKADLWDRRVYMEAAAFYIDWQDVQQQLNVPFGNVPGGVTAIVNAPSVSGVGFDFGLTARLADSLDVGVSLNWNDLTSDTDVISQGAVLFAEGDRLNFSPEYTASASADYVFPIGGGGFSGRLATSASYTSVQGFRSIINGAQSLAFGEPMLIARSSISIQAPAHWDVTVFVDNINDERDAIYGNPFAGFPLPFADVRVRPRTVGVQFEYRY
jgi:iron complex outermembrane recepter protein